MGRKRKIGITLKISNEKECVEVRTPSLYFEKEAEALLQKILRETPHPYKIDQS